MSEPLRVLHCITELRPGGAERVVHDLVRAADPRRLRVSVAALDGRGSYAGRIRELGAEVHDLGARSRWRLDAVWRLRALLRKERIDLLHTHLIHAGVVGRLAARPLGIPVVSTSHIVERRPVRWHFLLDRWTARWCRRIVCVSGAVREFQQERTRLPDALYSVVPNGIDLSRFADPTSRKAARARMHLPEKALVAGTLGRFDPQKGMDLLVRAAAEPVLAERGAVVVVSGYGPEEEALRRLGRRLRLGPGRLRFAGYQEAAEAYLPALDLFVCPSRWEGFGLVVVEAMACGLPVVASAVDSLPELVRDGVEGRLVPPEDPQALARVTAELLSDPAALRRMGAAARARAGAFGLDRMAAGYARIYDEILEPGGGGGEGGLGVGGVGGAEDAGPTTPPAG
jgi:glycosyltransferase involved in cell wall biosynthesis